MKKNLLLFVFLVCCMPLSSQELITTFYGDYLQKAYRVEATKPDAKGRFDLYVEMISLDALSDQCYMVIHRHSLNKCRAVLMAVAEKYIEWSTIAIKNNTEEVTKQIEVKIPNFVFSTAFKYGDWHRDITKKPRFVFKFEHNTAQLIISTGKITAHGNQFISSDGGAIVLSSLAEITDFIDCFEEKLVLDHYDEKKATEDLFQ